MIMSWLDWVKICYVALCFGLIYIFALSKFYFTTLTNVALRIFTSVCASQFQMPGWYINKYSLNKRWSLKSMNASTPIRDAPSIRSHSTPNRSALTSEYTVRWCHFQEWSHRAESMCCIASQVQLEPNSKPREFNQRNLIQCSATLERKNDGTQGCNLSISIIAWEKIACNVPHHFLISYKKLCSPNASH